MSAPEDPAPVQPVPMPDDTHFGYTPATHIARRIARREVSPVEVIRSTRERIDSLNEASVLAASATLESAQPWAHLRLRGFA